MEIRNEGFYPFTTSFTGTLTSFTIDGRTYTLKAPYMKCQKGQRFVVGIDAVSGKCRMLPLLMPDSGLR